MTSRPFEDQWAQRENCDLGRQESLRITTRHIVNCRSCGRWPTPHTPHAVSPSWAQLLP